MSNTLIIAQVLPLLFRITEYRKLCESSLAHNKFSRLPTSLSLMPRLQMLALCIGTVSSCVLFNLRRVRSAQVLLLRAPRV